MLDQTKVGQTDINMSLRGSEIFHPPGRHYTPQTVQ